MGVTELKIGAANLYLCLQGLEGTRQRDSQTSTSCPEVILGGSREQLWLSSGDNAVLGAVSESLEPLRDEWTMERRGSAWILWPWTAVRIPWWIGILKARMSLSSDYLEGEQRKTARERPRSAELH